VGQVVEEHRRLDHVVLHVRRREPVPSADGAADLRAGGGDRSAAVALPSRAMLSAVASSQMLRESQIATQRVIAQRLPTAGHILLVGV
jgi:hypothetical protein